MDQTLFITKARTASGKKMARRLVESLRTFGGELSRSPVWLFDTCPEEASGIDFAPLDVKVIPLVIPTLLQNYEFGDKVYACAQAEKSAPEGIRSLTWIDITCLVVNPPVEYILNQPIEAAFRPVHIRNVGLRSSEPLDGYWKGIYETLGIGDVERTVESFVDQECIRAYFNTHSFAVNPERGILRRWLDCFEKLLSDQDFQTQACADKTHQVFLHQAVLSAIISSSLSNEELRVLPSTYNYPYHLQGSIPTERRAETINELVTFSAEGNPIDPERVKDIEILEPLRTSLKANI